MKLVFALVMAASTTLGAEPVPGSASGFSLAPGVDSERFSFVHPDDPKSVVEAFHAALAAGDSASALDLLHPDVLVFEQGAAEDLQEYRSHHLAADIRFASQTTRHVIEPRAAIRGDVAIYTARTHTVGRVGSRDIDSNGVETMVLTLTDQGWRILHIHWSSR
jgi:ketosteroid isomerase-like protein